MTGRLRWWRRWRHWTLRARLGVSVIVLAGLALVVANAIGLLLLRSYLTDQIDDQLEAMTRQFERGVASGNFPSEPPPRPTRALGPDTVIYRYDPDGALVDEYESTTELSPPALDPLSELAARAGSGPFTVEAKDGGSGWRMVTVADPDGDLTVLGASLQEVDATVGSLLVIDAVVVAGMLVLLGLVAAWVVRVGLRPLTRMETTAAGITAGDLSRRVDDADPHTEPGRLGTALNTMLGRIESEVGARTASENRLRQFVTDASHELRTPLTSIGGFAELYRRGGAPPGPLLDEAMGRIEGETARMRLLVEDLLLLAKLDQHRPLDRRPVDLLAIAADTIRDARARTADRLVRLAGHDGVIEPVTVLGDEHRLRQVATNLVTNALQHTPPEARITVRVGRLDPEPDESLVEGWPPGAAAGLLEVADTGPGIPPEQAERIFERLYRVDQSRTRGHGGGTGLGLSIVAAIVESHGGRVKLDTAPPHGAVFRVLLPVVQSH